MTCSPSFLRNRPWSTKIDVNWSPIAFCKSTPTTDESTPPDRPSRTFLSPTCSRIFATCMSMKLSIVQSPLHWQTSRAKWRNSSLPYSEWRTSAWNWMPKKLRFVSWIAAIGQSLLVPTFSKPSGTCVTKSPWLIQTVCSFGVSVNRTALSETISNVACPYSRFLAGSTFPPRLYVISCMP